MSINQGAGPVGICEHVLLVKALFANEMFWLFWNLAFKKPGVSENPWSQITFLSPSIHPGPERGLVPYPDDVS